MCSYMTLEEHVPTDLYLLERLKLLFDLQFNDLPLTEMGF